MKFPLHSISILFYVMLIIFGCSDKSGYVLPDDEYNYLKKASYFESVFYNGLSKNDLSEALKIGECYIKFLDENKATDPCLSLSRKKLTVIFMFAALFFSDGRSAAVRFADEYKDVASVRELCCYIVVFYDEMRINDPELVPSWYNKERLQEAFPDVKTSVRDSGK